MTSSLRAFNQRTLRLTRRTGVRLKGLPTNINVKGREKLFPEIPVLPIQEKKKQQQLSKLHRKFWGKKPPQNQAVVGNNNLTPPLQNPVRTEI